ncbi:UTP--glucose-1-phosphate uridylyltransferase GalU [bacterium]|nr:UTP--glucose-1-phosphate uridylyltransferase GalU [bacterium]
MKKIRKAVFPVGGLGTRFLPATKTLAKEMLPVVDKPLVQYAFEEARDAGIEQFIFIMGRNKNAISNHFDNAYELQTILGEKNKRQELEQTIGWLPEAGNLIFTRQQQPLGLGHAVWCARHLIGDEPFAVLLADDMVLAPQKPCLKQMVEAYAGLKGDGNLVAVQNVSREHTSRYGILATKDEKPQLVSAYDMVEKPKPDNAPSTLAVIGRYILQPDIFDYLDKHEKGAGGEIQLTDAIRAMLPGSPLFGFRFDGIRYDCGSKEGFLEANIAYALERPDLRDAMQDILRKYALAQAA